MTVVVPLWYNLHMDIKAEVAQVRIHEIETEMEDVVEKLRSDIEDVVRGVWPEFDEDDHVITTMMECPSSPFGFCAYHRWEDPAWDDCLFCEDPYERK